MKLKMMLAMAVAVLSMSAKAFAEPDPNFWVFLCFGQSNMGGGGRIEAQDKEPVKRFEMMAAVNFPKLKREMGKWYDAVPPLNSDSSGLSMVDYFGRTMVKGLPENVKVGVIVVAVAGCKIELFDKENHQKYLSAPDTADWLRNAAKDYNSNPYQRLVEMGKLAQKDGVIKGMLLHQGESNPSDEEWPGKVKAIYDNLCKDLTLKPEETPFLAGEVVGEDQNGTCKGRNKLIAKLPYTLPNSYVISSAGCKANGDRLHFSSEGCREFGKRYGEQMLALMGHPVKEPSVPVLPKFTVLPPPQAATQPAATQAK
jgi:hypothetical protein